MFYSEQVWEVAASLAIVGAIPWGAALYFSKRTHKPFFSQVAKPPFYPGYIAIHFVSLVVSLLYALAFYYVWANHGGWSGEPVALALVCGAQFLGVIGAFVTWVWFSPVSVMIGGAVTVLAGFAAIASAVWVFWAEAVAVAFWYTLIAIAWYLLLGAAMIYLGYYGNNYKLSGVRCCPTYIGPGQWPAVDYCEDLCPETGPPGDTCITVGGGGGVVVMEGGGGGISLGGGGGQLGTTPGKPAKETAGPNEPFNAEIGAIGLNVQDCMRASGANQKLSVRTFSSAPSSAASKRYN